MKMGRLLLALVIGAGLLFPAESRGTPFDEAGIRVERDSPVGARPGEAATGFSTETTASTTTETASPSAQPEKMPYENIPDDPFGYLAKRGVKLEPSSGRNAWTLEEAGWIAGFISTLPDSFVKCTKKIKKDSWMIGNPAGKVFFWSTDTVHVYRRAMSGGNGFLQVLAHEMMHAYSLQNKDFERDWKKTFWPKGKPEPASVSAYGNTNFREDMAESFRTMMWETWTIDQNPTRKTFLLEWWKRNGGGKGPFGWL